MRILLAIALALTPGCSGLKMDGGCTYERVVSTRYVCEPAGKVEHYRLAPVEP